MGLPGSTKWAGLQICLRLSPLSLALGRRPRASLRGFAKLLSASPLADFVTKNLMASNLDWKSSEDPRDLIHIMVQALVEGRIVVIPAETTYLAVASALSVPAIEKLTEMFSAGAVGAPSLMVRSSEESLDFAYPLSRVAQRMVGRGWPGPLVLELPTPADNSLVSQLPSATAKLLLDEAFLPLRVSAHETITQTMRLVAGPLVAAPLLVDSQPTSDGKVACSVDDDRVAFVVDAGKTHFDGLAATVRVQENKCIVRNAGVLEHENLERLGQLVVLLVCTGNTCRSPMAEVLLRSKLRAAFPQRFANDAQPVFVASAGLSAFPGGPASPEAISVMKKRGLSLLDHQSRAVTERALRTADLVLTMTESHRSAIVDRMPSVAEKVSLLSNENGNVSDPFGGSESVYAACAEQIDGFLDQWVSAMDDSWFAEWETE